MEEDISVSEQFVLIRGGGGKQQSILGLAAFGNIKTWGLDEEDMSGKRLSTYLAEGSQSSDLLDQSIIMKKMLRKAKVGIVDNEIYVLGD